MHPTETLVVTSEAKEPRNLCEQRAQIIVHTLQKAYGRLLGEPRYVVKDDQVLVEIFVKDREDPIGMHVRANSHKIWGIKGVRAPHILGEIDEALKETTEEFLDDVIGEEVSGL